MNNVIPFPPNKEKLKNIRLAEQLLTVATAIERASIPEPDGSFEFGLFPGGEGLLYAACLVRDADGKVTDSAVLQFKEKDGFNWFKEMQGQTNE